MDILGKAAWGFMQILLGIVGFLVVSLFLFGPSLYAVFKIRRAWRFTKGKIHLSTALCLLLSTGALLGLNVYRRRETHSVYTVKNSEWGQTELPCTCSGFPFPVYRTVNGSGIPNGIALNNNGDIDISYQPLENGDYYENDEPAGDFLCGLFNLNFALLVLVSVYYRSEKSIRERSARTLRAGVELNEKASPLPPPPTPASPRPTPAETSVRSAAGRL